MLEVLFRVVEVLSSKSGMRPWKRAAASAKGTKGDGGGPLRALCLRASVAGISTASVHYLDTCTEVGLPPVAGGCPSTAIAVT